MSLMGFEEIESRADEKTRSECVGLAVAGGADKTVLEAMASAHRRGWVHPILVGNRGEIERLASELEISLAGMRIVDSETPAQDAVREVRAGRARMLMKGQIATPELMKGVLQAEVGLRTGRTLCQVVAMEIPRDGRCFLMSDTGICISPNEQQLIEILENLVTVALGITTQEPIRVALMAATEKVSESMPETILYRRLVELNKNGLLPHCRIEGPLSFDLAYAPDAGEKKKLEGDVIGQADAMLFPNLLSANLTVKAIMYTADCRFGGVVMGAACPIVFMSRADTTETRLRSLALALSISNQAARENQA